MHPSTDAGAATRFEFKCTLADRLAGSLIDCHPIQTNRTAVDVKSVARRMYEDGVPHSLHERAERTHHE